MGAFDNLRFDLDDLTFTQNIRRDLVNKIIQEKQFHLDGDLTDKLLRALDGIDKQVFTSAKLKSDEEQGDRAFNAASAAMELSRRLRRQGENPFMQRKDTSGVPLVQEEIPDVPLKEGMTDIAQGGQPTINWETFEKKMEHHE